MAETRTITLRGRHDIGDDHGPYGPGEVTVAPHVADLLERMDVPAQEAAAAEREARKAERAERRKDGGA